MDSTTIQTIITLLLFVATIGGLIYYHRRHV